MGRTIQAPNQIKAVFKLAELIAKHFNLPQLDRLAPAVGIDPNDLPGQTLSNRAYSLADAAVRQDLLDFLCARLQEERPAQSPQWSALCGAIRMAPAHVAAQEGGNRNETQPILALERKQRRALIQILLVCPIMDTQEGRDRVVAVIRPVVKEIISSHDKGIHIANIVDAAAGHPEGLEELFEALRLYESDPKALQSLESVWSVICSVSPSTATQQISRHYTVNRDDLFHEFDLFQQQQKFNEALQKKPPSNIVIYVAPARDAFLIESYVLRRFKKLATLQRNRAGIDFREIKLRQADLQNQPLSAAVVIWKLTDTYPGLQLADLFDDRYECLLTIFNDDLPIGPLQQIADSFANELQNFVKSWGKPAGRYLVIIWVNLLGEPLQLTAGDELLRLTNAGEIPALGYLARQEVVNWLEFVLPRMGVEKPDVALSIGYLKQHLRDDPAPLHRIYITLEAVCNFLQKGA